MGRCLLYDYQDVTPNSGKKVWWICQENMYGKPRLATEIMAQDVPIVIGGETCTNKK